MRADTRQRVEKAIQDLGFRPSTIARGLTSKRTFTVGMLVSDISNPFYGEVVHGVEDVAFGGAYQFFLCNTHYDNNRGLAYVRALVDKQVDGVLIMSSSVSDQWMEELASNNVHAVVLDWEGRVTGGQVHSVRVDFQTGIRAAVQHLLALGHRQLAHVSGPLQLKTSQSRRDAFLQALTEAGITAGRVAVVEGNLQIDGGRRALAQLLALPERPTAIFAANDLTAVGLLSEARANGLQVPDDLSIVGLDDIWLASESEPPLTTVALPRYEIGRLCMQALLNHLSAAPGEANPPEVSVFHTTLVVRQSTGAAPTRAHAVAESPLPYDRSGSKVIGN